MSSAPGAKYLDITQSQASPLIKFGFLCTNRQNIPRWFGILCLIICYLQSIAMFLKNTQLILSSKDDSIQAVWDTFTKVLSCSGWIPTKNTYAVKIGAPVIGIFLLHILVLLGYLAYKIIRKRQISEYIQTYWSSFCYFYPLVLFFPIHAFSTQVLELIFDDKFSDSVGIGYTIVFYFLVIINIIFAASMTRLFHVVMKTKDPLACKNNAILIKDIGSKVFFPILWMFYSRNDWLDDIISITSLWTSITNDLILFYYLPYYRISVLKVSAALQGALTSLAFVTFVTKILSYTKLNLGLYFLQVTWVVLIPLSMKLYLSVLFRLLKRIMEQPPSKFNMYHLIHKPYIIRHLMKNRKLPHEQTQKYDYTYFLFMGKIVGIAEYFNFSIHEISTDKQHFKQVTKTCMLNIGKKYPKDDLTKVILANFYVRTENAYLLANNLIEEVLSGAPCFAVRISLSLIRFELQKKLFTQYTSGTDDAHGGLNILKFVQTNKINEKLKDRMKKQAKLQADFWKTFQAGRPELGDLYEFAIKVNQEKQTIQKIWKQLLKVKSSTFTYPLLMYGMYVSFVSNDTNEGEKYIESYGDHVQKFSRIAQTDELNNETLMCEDTAQISMSGSRTKIGKILSCSNNIIKALGWKKEFLTGRQITQIMPPYYQEKHDRFLINHYNTGKTKILNQTALFPTMSSDGYIRPCHVHIKMNPLVEDGISYIGTIKRLRMPRRMVLVRKDGIIDAMSKNFAYDMNLLTNPEENAHPKFSSFCPEFRFVNAAFNRAASKAMGENPPPQAPNSAGLKFQSLSASPERNSPNREKRKESGGDFNKAAQRALTQLEEDNHAAPTLLSRNENNTPFHYEDPETLGLSCSETKLQEFYDNYTTGGKLVLMPRECSDKTPGTLIKLHHHQPITYHVTIVNRIHGNQFIKIMLLDKIENEEDDHDVLKPRYSIRHSTKIRVSQATGSLVGDELAIQKRVSAEKMISPDSSTFLPNNNQSLLGSFLSPKGNHSMLSPKEGTTRRLLANEQEPKIADHDENEVSYVSQAMSVFDEMQCQNMIKMNLTNREGISTYREDNIFSSTRRYGDNQKLIGVGSPSTIFRKQDDELIKYQVDHHDDHEDLHHNNVLEVETVGSKVITAVFGIGGGSVSLDEHKKDPHAGEQSRGITKEEVHDAIALKEKLRNLRHKMTKGIMEAVKAESVSSSYLSQGKKLQTMISRALITRTCHRSDRIFSYSFIVFVLIVLIFQILQALNIFRAVHKVKDEVSLLETGVFRVNALIILARYMRISTYVLQGYFSLFGNWNEDVAQSQQWITDYTNNLNDYDNEFRVKLEDIGPSFQSAFYEDNVKLYRRNESQALNYFTTSSNFQSVTLMLTKAFAAASANYSTGIDITSPEFADLNFVADNAYNSLLLSSEDTIYLLLDDLDDIVVQIKTKMFLIFGLLMGIAAVFIGFCIRYLFQMRSKAKIFMNMFFRLTSSEIHEAQSLLDHFSKCIDSNNIHEIEFVPKQEKAKNPEKNPGLSVKNNFREASMDKIHQKQILLLLRICPFFIMILALNIGYLILAYSTINRITEEQNQIGSSLSTLYSESLAVSLFVDMILTNASVTVRNGPIQEQFLYTIASIQNINEIVNDFRDSDGKLTTEQHNVFYEFPCSNIYDYDIQYSDTVYTSCVEVAAGTDTMSLVGVTTGLVDAMKKVYTTFFASARTFNDIIDNFQLTIGEIQNYAFLFGPLCEILFDTTQENFLQRTSSVQSQALIFTLITCLWLIAGAVFCWFRTLISIFYFQDTDRIVLQLVPIRIILANKYLKQYLLKIANGTLERVKRFM